MKIDLENNSSHICDEARLISLADFSLNQLGIHPDSELAIRLVDEIEMEKLHLKWMDLNQDSLESNWFDLIMSGMD